MSKYKQVEDRYGAVADESIQSTLKALYEMKHGEEPTPLSIERIHKYITFLEEKLDI